MQPPLRSCNPLLEPVTLPDLRLDQDDPSGLDKQNAQVAIALFGYLAEDRAVSGRDLPRHQSEPGAKIPSVGEHCAADDRGAEDLWELGP